MVAFEVPVFISVHRRLKSLTITYGRFYHLTFHLLDLRLRLFILEGNIFYKNIDIDWDFLLCPSSPTTTAARRGGDGGTLKNEKRRFSFLNDQSDRNVIWVNCKRTT